MPRVGSGAWVSGELCSLSFRGKMSVLHFIPDVGNWPPAAVPGRVTRTEGARGAQQRWPRLSTLTWFSHE